MKRRAKDDSRRAVGRRSRRRPTARRRTTQPRPSAPQSTGFWGWLKRLFGGDEPPRGGRRPRRSASEQEGRVLKAFCRHFNLEFENIELLRLALTHRSYLSVTKGTRESNERLEFLGDSVLGLVTSESLYQRHPDEHEGQLTKTKSLLVSKAILSRRSLAMGLGRFVFMSHSEIESGGRQRLSILADAFEAVVGAIYLDQGFEASRAFIDRWLLSSSSEIVADKRHTNYKSHLQEYVQSTFRTHPVYRIRREVGPDHSKQFHVEVIVGRRNLGSGSGPNKKEAEQAAARDALERVEQRNVGRSGARRGAPDEAEDRTATARPEPVERPGAAPVAEDDDSGDAPRRRRGRRGGRGRRARTEAAAPAASELSVARPVGNRRSRSADLEPTAVRPLEPSAPAGDVRTGPWNLDDEFDEVGRPEGPMEERHIDLYGHDDESEDRASQPMAETPAEAPVDRPTMPPEVAAETTAAGDDGAEADRFDEGSEVPVIEPVGEDAERVDALTEAETEPELEADVETESELDDAQSEPDDAPSEPIVESDSVARDLEPDDVTVDLGEAVQPEPPPAPKPTFGRRKRR